MTDTNWERLAADLAIRADRAATMKLTLWVASLGTEGTGRMGARRIAGRLRVAENTARQALEEARAMGWIDLSPSGNSISCRLAEAWLREPPPGAIEPSPIMAVIDHDPALKSCFVCHQLKPHDAFGKNRARPDGLHTYCRQCRSDRDRAKYAENPTPVRDRVRAWEAKNASKIRERRKANSEEFRSRARESYRGRMADPDAREAYNEYHRRYRAENRERIRRISNTYHHRTKLRDMGQILRKRAIRRHLERTAAGFATTEQLQARWNLYDGRCYICAQPAEEFDHYKPLTAGGTHWPANLRPVCAGCNARKGYLWPIDLTQLRARILAEYGPTRAAN